VFRESQETQTHLYIYIYIYIFILCEENAKNLNVEVSDRPTYKRH
jgi:hypothetical protein